MKVPGFDSQDGRSEDEALLVSSAHCPHGGEA